MYINVLLTSKHCNSILRQKKYFVAPGANNLCLTCPLKIVIQRTISID